MTIVLDKQSSFFQNGRAEMQVEIFVKTSSRLVSLATPSCQPSFNLPVYRAGGSGSPTTTQGLKIIEKKVLPLL